MLTKENLAQFSTHLFWDTTVAEVLKLDNPLPFLVQRVLEYGQIQDWFYLKDLIGVAGITQVAKSIKTLEYKSAKLVATVSNEPIENFACYTTRQLNPNFWNS
ncbi:MAG: hypothetical protein L6Q78_13725 [Bacteroidia bacterium]|nr:hypothetical protein [Bacteroidia bacterium]